MNSTVDRQKELNEKIAALLGRHYHKPTEDEIKLGSYYQYEPDYCNDLNAMHEIEKLIPENQSEVYWQHLLDLCNASPGTLIERATALQRAEAFVKVMEATSVQKP